MNGVARKIAGMALKLLAVSFLVYAVLEVNSGEVAVKVLGQFSTEVQRAHWLHANGYDAPFMLRYLRWLGDFLRGDWGISTHYRIPVIRIVPHRLLATAWLASLTLLVMVPLGLGLGILSGVFADTPADRAISTLSIVTTSIPDYASCAFLSAIFVVGLRWLPGASTMTDGLSLRQMVLPVMVLSLYSMGYIARITRAAVREELRRPYIRTARLKGASRARVVLRHALRNALLAPVTVIMLQIPWLLSGVIVVEVFFAYRGFGSLLYEAALNSDLPVIEACTMLSVIVVGVTQQMSDGLNAWLNPRLRRLNVAPFRTAAT